MISEISPEEAAKAAEAGKTLFIDVRDEEESRGGRVPNANRISRGTLESEIEEIAPESATPIVCYCGGGGRSTLAVESLQKMGYTNVRSIAGGFKAWQAAGLPVER